MRKDDYLKFRVVGIDENGKFIDYPIKKVRRTVELIFLLKQLEDQLEHIHKVYIKKHSTTNIIIGVDIQAKLGFDYDKMVNTGVSNLHTPLVDGFKNIVGNRNYWNHIRYCHNCKKEILESPVPVKHRNASQDDLIRSTLVRRTR